MHTHMSTSLVNHYQANLQGYRTCTGVAKIELSASPSKNTFAVYIYMWQSQVEIEHYSIAYFAHIAVFEAL